MSEERDDKALEHFKSRSARPTAHKQAVPLVGILEYDSDLSSSVNYGRKWNHVGTSPQLSPADILQARRRMQTMMADS